MTAVAPPHRKKPARKPLVPVLAHPLVSATTGFRWMAFTSGNLTAPSPAWKCMCTRPTTASAATSGSYDGTAADPDRTLAFFDAPGRSSPAIALRDGAGKHGGAPPTWGCGAG